MIRDSLIFKGINYIRSLLPDGNLISSKMGLENAPLRLVVIANAYIPTVQLSIVHPLQTKIRNGDCAISFVTEQDLKQNFCKDIRSVESAKWMTDRVFSENPTHIIFCRYSGPHYQEVCNIAKQNGIASIYIIDDDLFNVPIEIGKQKYEYHNHPLRLAAVRFLLENVDLVYCSNERLKLHFLKLGVSGNFHAGDIFCGGEVISPAEERPAMVMGYMGFDHAHDFEIALPGVIHAMRKYGHLRFELFGKIPKPQALEQFGGRVVEIPVVGDYEQFLKQFAARKWDIGICPLAPTAFNLVKNQNKWVEYTAVGAAVIASQGRIYDKCCANGCGILVGDDEWGSAFEALLENPKLRFLQICNAQRKLIQEYSTDQLSEQVIRILEMASTREVIH